MKDKLEVGMYVRTKKGIAKIKKIFSDDDEPYYGAKYETDVYLEIYYDSEYVSEDYVLKSSHNIIDLIEVGDYVNGELVVAIHKNYVCDEIELGIALETACNYTAILNEDIKSIVTKESMESVTYYVK